MNFILVLFIILATMFLASSANNLISVMGAVDHFMEISKVPDLFAVGLTDGKEDVIQDYEDKINGFMQGADDYVDKPVDMDILCAKVTALMRRNYDLKQENTVVHSGAITIDKEAKQVFLDKKEIALTVKEYELLLLLVENPGKTLNKEYLFNQIWGMDSFSENQTLTVHIKMLRDKIEDNPKEPQRIKTVWGVGYKYEEK